MVEQEAQSGQQYCTSQPYMEPISQLCSLNLHVISRYSPVDITKSRSLTNSQVQMEANSESQDFKLQSSVTESSYTSPYHGITDDIFTGFSDLSDFNVDTSLAKYDYSSTSPFSWNSPVDAPNYKLDDVFQVDEADLFHGPTLAELNANDESLFDSFDSLESYLPSENKMSSFQFQPINTAELESESNVIKSELKEKSCNNYNVHFFTKEKKQHTKANSEMSDVSLAYSINIQNSSSETEKLKSVKQFPIKHDDSSLSQLKQASKLEDKDLLLLKYKEQEKDKSVKKHQLKDELECSSDTLQNFFHKASSMCNDELSEKDDSNDKEEDSSSDSDSDISHTSRKRSLNKNNSINKKIRYFWQYNIKPKGPNSSSMQSSNHASDICSSMNFRRGDGTDLTPNPQKLYNIGMELEKLNSVINNLIPVSKLPASAKMKSRKEKNKLASRACRLKKKAYHEANKLKNFGLQQEYELLQHIISESKKILTAKLQDLESSMSCQKEIALILSKDTKKVAGCTTEYVNTILHSVKEGNGAGGLNDI